MAGFATSLVERLCTCWSYMGMPQLGMLCVEKLDNRYMGSLAPLSPAHERDRLSLRCCLSFHALLCYCARLQLAPDVCHVSQVGARQSLHGLAGTIVSSE